MCLIAFQYKMHPDYPFILIANRDESYQRPSAPLHFWEDEPNILAGRDLVKMGTWLGVTRKGRFAALTNHPFANWVAGPEIHSRGNLVRNYLSMTDSPDDYAFTLKETRKQYDGYRLLFGDMNELYLFSNVPGTSHKYHAGLHSFSNTEDDLSKHRRQKAEKLLTDYIQKHPALDPSDMIDLFRDTEPALELSNIPPEVTNEDAKKYSSIFIKGDVFGTVATTAIMVDKKGNVTVMEQQYGQSGPLEETQQEFFLEK